MACPVCGATSEGGYAVGDTKVFNCPACGDNRLSGTAIALIEKGTQKPDPRHFRVLVQRKRGNSTEYPVMTESDVSKYAPTSPFTVGRELGHGGDALVRRVYGHLGEVRHRAAVVEYCVEQHAAKLGDRLAALNRSDSVSASVSVPPM